jgi:hypothetical protein
MSAGRWAYVWSLDDATILAIAGHADSAECGRVCEATSTNRYWASGAAIRVAFERRLFTRVPPS